MNDDDWNNPQTRSQPRDVPLREGAGHGGRGGEAGGSTDDLLLVVNGSHVDLDWVLLPKDGGGPEAWQLLVDTGDVDRQESVAPSGTTRLEARTLKLYRRKAMGERMSVAP